MKKVCLLAFFLINAFSATTFGQRNITSQTIATENFNSLGTSATASIPANWKASSAGTGLTSGWTTGTNLTATTQSANSGKPTAGGIYSFGTSVLSFQSKLDDFSWVIGSWENTNPTDKTLLKWIKINDTLFRSYRIETKGAGRQSTTSDFYIYQSGNKVYAAIKQYKWELISGGKDGFTFSNDTGVYRQIHWLNQEHNAWTITTTGNQTDITSLKKLEVEDPKIDDLVAHIEELRTKRAKEPRTESLPFPLSGKPAPLFVAKTIDGQEVSLEHLKGKVVVINFWFTTCVPCIKEMPGLNKLTEKYQKEDVIFLAVTWNNEEEIRAFLKKHDFKFQIVANRKDIVLIKYLKERAAFPTTFVIDRIGIVRSVISGLTLISDIEKSVRAVL